MMRKTIGATAAAVAMMLTGIAACVDSEDGAQLNGVAQAVVGMHVRIRYFSDDTYTTQVGHEFWNCFGPPNISGTRTGFTTGFVAECEGGTSYGCYMFIDGQVSCPAPYSACISCW